MTRLRSHLAKHQQTQPFNDEEIQNYARRAYHQKDLVLVQVAELTDPFVKQEIINYANRKYGKK